MSLKANPDLPAFVALPGLFNRAEIDRILLAGNRVARKEGAVDQGRHHTMRRSHVGWLPAGFDKEIIEKIGHAIADVNEAKYGFQLSGFREPLQFTHYRGPGDKYDWHMDLGAGKLAIRKLSFSIQLSNPGSYAECNLEFFRHQGLAVNFRTEGTMIVFPSYEIHRVTPLTQGERYSLVGWVSGNPFI